MIVLLCLLGLIACFYLLSLVCEDYFVESLDIISNKLKLSQDVAGATLMAIGSSAPELFTAMIALTKVGSENVGAGTIVGSAIFNVLVIVGVSVVVATAYLDWRPVMRDMLFYIVSILLLLFTFRDGVITTTEVAWYLSGYLVYLILLSQWSKYVKSPQVEVQESKEKKKPPKTGALRAFHSASVGLLARIFPDLKENPERYWRTFTLSILMIGALSWSLVELAVILAHAIGVSEVIIALTVLAAGTSVPDLLSSMIVARQGRGGMAVSNAVGSNTFDILIGLGLPWCIYIMVTQKNVTVSTENLLSSIFLLFATVIALLFIMAVQKFRIGAKSGYVLIFLYVAYLSYTIYSVYHPEVMQLEQYLATVLNAS